MSLVHFYNTFSSRTSLFHAQNKCINFNNIVENYMDTSSGSFVQSKDGPCAICYKVTANNKVLRIHQNAIAQEAFSKFYSFAFWFKIPSAVSGTLLSVGGEGDSNGYILNVSAGSGGMSHLIFSSGCTVEFLNNSWHFLVVSYDDERCGVYYSLDGLPIGKDSEGGYAKILLAADYIGIGGLVTSAGATSDYVANSEFALIKVYNHMLTIDEIKGLYNEPTVIFPLDDGLEQLDDGLGNYTDNIINDFNASTGYRDKTYLNTYYLDANNNSELIFSNSDGTFNIPKGTSYYTLSWDTQIDRYTDGSAGYLHLYPSITCGPATITWKLFNGTTASGTSCDINCDTLCVSEWRRYYAIITVTCTTASQAYVGFELVSDTLGMYIRNVKLERGQNNEPHYKHKTSHDIAQIELPGIYDSTVVPYYEDAISDIYEYDGGTYEKGATVERGDYCAENDEAGRGQYGWYVADVQPGCRYRVTFNYLYDDDTTDYGCFCLYGVNDVDSSTIEHDMMFSEKDKSTYCAFYHPNKRIGNYYGVEADISTLESAYTEIVFTARFRHILFLGYYGSIIQGETFGVSIQLDRLDCDNNFNRAIEVMDYNRLSNAKTAGEKIHLSQTYGLQGFDIPELIPHEGGNCDHQVYSSSIYLNGNNYLATSDHAHYIMPLHMSGFTITMWIKLYGEGVIFSTSRYYLSYVSGYLIFHKRNSGEVNEIASLNLEENNIDTEHKFLLVVRFESCVNWDSSRNSRIIGAANSMYGVQLCAYQNTDYDENVNYKYTDFDNYVFAKSTQIDYNETCGLGFSSSDDHVGDYDFIKSPFVIGGLGQYSGKYDGSGATYMYDGQDGQQMDHPFETIDNCIEARIGAIEIYPVELTNDIILQQKARMKAYTQNGTIYCHDISTFGCHERTDDIMVLPTLTGVWHSDYPSYDDTGVLMSHDSTYGYKSNAKDYILI